MVPTNYPWNLSSSTAVCGLTAVCRLLGGDADLCCNHAAAVILSAVISCPDDTCALSPADCSIDSLSGGCECDRQHIPPCLEEKVSSEL